jgi:hypothetical protein
MLRFTKLQRMGRYFDYQEHMAGAHRIHVLASWSCIPGIPDQEASTCGEAPVLVVTQYQYLYCTVLLSTI